MHKFSPWFYPKPTGDLGRDRNARTIQFACVLFATAIALFVLLDAISRKPVERMMVVAVVGLGGAAIINRAGRSDWAAWIGILTGLLTAILLVFNARDGFRSHAMLVFPGLLLISVMLLDRAHYVTTAGIVLLAVAAVGIAEKHGFTGATPRERTPTSYNSIFYVDLTLLVFAVVGSRIVRDAETNVSDLRANISGLSAANRDLTDTAVALRESEQQLVSIYNTVQDIIFHLAVEPGGQFRFVSVNAAFLWVTGLSREAVVGKTVHEVIPEPSLTMVLGKYRQAIEENTIVSWEETSDYPMGRLTGEVSVAPVLDNKGTCSHLVGSVHDITERKHAEATLRESEERFRSMADTVPAMIWIFGLDKHCTFVNKSWLDFVGHTMEQEMGNGWAAGIHTDDMDRCLTTYSSSFDARRKFQIEYRLRRADGEYRWILANGAPFYRRGEFAGYIGSCTDITEQKVIEERLRGSETLLKGAQRLARIGSWEREIDDRKAYWSDEMFRIYGLRNQEAPPTFPNLLSHVHAEDRQRFLKTHEVVCSTDLPVHMEFRIVRPDGEIKWARTIMEAVRNDHGAVVRTVGATQDVTDQKRAQEESFSRQKLESIGTLASGIAHDFNNLLGAVLAQADLGLSQFSAGDSPKESLRTIQNLAMRGSEIVQQLMAYAGEKTEGLELVNVSSIVQEMLGLLKVSISKHAALETNLGNELPAVRANAAQLRQIIMNLITNASEAIGNRDGVIRVMTKRVSVGPDALIAKDARDGDYLQLAVADTGSGMSSETQARVFDPFFTSKSAGRGLGLWVVHGLVKSLGGSIHIASELGKGTTVQILLPCAVGMGDALIEPVLEAGESISSAQRFRVLVVEDEDALREAVVKILHREGFEVWKASNGSAAIDLLRAKGDEIDLILLDMTLPGASSQEVVTEAAKVRPDVKIILTSAYSQEMVRDRISAPQISAFVRKPFRLGDVVKMLQDAAVS